MRTKTQGANVMNLIIYGVGKGFNKIDASDFWQQVEEMGYYIKDIVDGDVKKTGFKIEILEKEFIVRLSGKEFWDDNKNSYVYIAADSFYVEIKEQLVKLGVLEEYILENNFLYKKCLEKVFKKDMFTGKGLEIGGPSPVFTSIYEMCEKCDDVDFSMENVWHSNKEQNYYVIEGRKLGCKYIADATDLKVLDDEVYDFVLSSNNLEHIANPLKALKEFLRVLNKNGKLVLLLPNKKYSFDHKRNDTLFEHLLEDYYSDVAEDDLTHLDEILEKHDLSMDVPMNYEQFKQRSLNNFHNRCLHHHVFSEKLMIEMAVFFDLKIVDVGEKFDNIYMIVQKGN